MMRRRQIQTTETRSHPFRRAVLRGLATVLPPLLTIVIFVWISNTVAVYLLEPLEKAGRRVIVSRVADIQQQKDLDPGTDPQEPTYRGIPYVRLRDDLYVPKTVYETVKQRGWEPIPTTARGIYDRYVQITYLKRYIVVPIFLWLFVVFLYLLGKFLAARVGRFFWGIFERGIHRLPLIRNVYSSVKQVTDFLFSERDIEYTRVVAVEYPRKGVWSLGLVTGNSMVDIRNAASEPVLSVLVPTSPMPVTGVTVTVKKSETVDLDITIDQAFQFIVSCGVVVPPQQSAETRRHLESPRSSGAAETGGLEQSPPPPASRGR